MASRPATVQPVSAGCQPACCRCLLLLTPPGVHALSCPQAFPCGCSQLTRSTPHRQPGTDVTPAQHPEQPVTLLDALLSSVLDSKSLALFQPAWPMFDLPSGPIICNISSGNLPTDLVWLQTSLIAALSGVPKTLLQTSLTKLPFDTCGCWSGCLTPLRACRTSIGAPWTTSSWTHHLAPRMSTSPSHRCWPMQSAARVLCAILIASLVFVLGAGKDDEPDPCADHALRGGGQTC